MIDTDEGARKSFDESLSEAVINIVKEPSLFFTLWVAAIKLVARVWGSQVERISWVSWASLLSMEAWDPESTSTSWREYESKTMPSGVLAANVCREQEMARRLRALCSGELTGGKGKKKAVVVVVGRNHVHPLRMLLRQTSL
jgi:hypothetical protein